jgi:hypothetical protein
MLRNRLCHTLEHLLTQTEPRGHGSSSPPAPDAELSPGDRVEGLANFGKPPGDFGTVEPINLDDALVKWDEDARMRLRQPWLKKLAKRFIPLASKQMHRCAPVPTRAVGINRQ